MNEHEDLIARLRALGSQPVSPETSGRHLAAIKAAPEAGSGRSRSQRLRIVAAFAVGLLAGTSGLATAGALPDGPQEVAHRAFGAVGVKVPHGDRYQGPECGGEFKNHGQYVRSQPKDKRAEAAASRCGKPIQAGTGDDSVGGQSDCQGPPPWAGKGKPDQAAKEARRQACGNQDEKDENPAAPGGGTANVGPEDPATKRIVPPASDDTSEPTTTTGTGTATTTTTATTATTTTAGSGEETTSTTTTSTTGPVLDPTPATPPGSSLGS